MKSKDLEHFKRLVAAGGAPGSSSGERAAAALAQAAVLHGPSLDVAAWAGFCDFLRWSVDRYPECRDWLAAHGGVEF